MPRGPVAALVLAAIAVYTLLALRSPLPVLFPDEVRYAHLARSLADGEGLRWRGDPISQPAALYLYMLAPVWALLSSSVAAFAVAKVLGTVALCAQAVAVWLIARTLLRDERLALAPAALSLAGTWMLTGAGTTTEALAMPLCTTGLCLAVAALRRPGSRLGWAALALVVLAAWARIQLAVLVPALAAAITLDVVRLPGAAVRHARLRAHAPLLAVTAGLSLALGVAALAAPSLAGDYAGILQARPPFVRIAGRSGLELLEVVALCGLLPFVLALAATLSPAAWRDPAAGPLLALLWPVVAVTVVQSGMFLAGFLPAQSGIQRYVFYAVPLLLLLTVVLAERPTLLARPALVAATGATVLGLLGRPAIAMMGEERAAWSTGYRVHQLLGLEVGPALALVVLLCVAGLAALLWRARGGNVAVGATAIVLAVLVVQSEASWHQLLQTTRSFRSIFPADLAWIDHHADGPVAVLAVTQTSPQFADLELFNRRIRQVYAPPSGVAGPGVLGRRCTFRFLLSGALSADPACGRLPRWYLIDDPAAVVTFQREERAVSDPRIGRLAKVAAGVPRARSVLVLACPRPSPVYSPTTPDVVPASAPRPCAPSLSASLWLPTSGRLVLRYRGGDQPQIVTIGAQRFTLAPRVLTSVRVAVAAGYSQTVIAQDWISTGGAPTLQAARVETAATTTPIL